MEIALVVIILLLLFVIVIGLIVFINHRSTQNVTPTINQAYDTTDQNDEKWDRDDESVQYENDDTYRSESDRYEYGDTTRTDSDRYEYDSYNNLYDQEIIGPVVGKPMGVPIPEGALKNVHLYPYNMAINPYPNPYGYPNEVPYPLPT